MLVELYSILLWLEQKEVAVKEMANRTTFRSYLFFWSGQLFSLLGSSIAQFVIIWWITLETESTFYLAIAALLGFAPMVILGPFTGVLVDRWSRRKLIGIADLLQAFATIALIFLFWMDVVVLWHVFVLLTVRGVFQAFHGPAVFAIVPTMVPEDKLSRMNGISYFFTSGVNLVAPVIAALLLGFLEIGQILWIDPATSIVALIPLLLITIPSVRKEQDESSFRKQFSEGFAFIKSTRGLMSFIVLATGLNFLLAPLSTLLPYYVKFDHFGAVSDLAFVMAFSQGGMVAGGLLMSVVTGFKRKMVVIISAIYVLFIGYIMIALTPTGLFWFMAASSLIITFCFPIIDVLITTMLQTVVPVEMQGRITSVTMSLAHAAQPAGMVISGVVAIFTGTANLFLGCAGLGILLATLSWVFTDVRHVGKTG